METTKKRDLEFSLVMHSVKQKIFEIGRTGKRPSRFIIGVFNNNKYLNARPNNSVVPRNMMKIQNFEASQRYTGKTEDDLLTCLTNLIDELEIGDHCRSITENAQAFFAWGSFRIWRATKYGDFSIKRERTLQGFGANRNSFPH